MTYKLPRSLAYFTTRFTKEELDWMNRKDVGDRTEYLRRWYDSMVSPVPEDEARIPDFNYKIRPMDVYIPQQFTKVDRTIEDVKKKIIRDSEPAMNPSYLTTKVPDVIDHNKLAMTLINSKREYNETSSNMDQTALMNLGFSQQQITDLFGKTHTLNNIGISDNLKQNLDKINVINKVRAKLDIKEPNEKNEKNDINADIERIVNLERGEIGGPGYYSDSGDESDHEADYESADDGTPKEDTPIVDIPDTTGTDAVVETEDESDDDGDAPRDNEFDTIYNTFSTEQKSQLKTNMRYWDENIQTMLQLRKAKNEKFLTQNAFNFIVTRMKMLQGDENYANTYKKSIHNLRVIYKRIVIKHIAGNGDATSILSQINTHFKPK